VSNANFKRAIQSALDTNPACLSVSLPSEPRNTFTQEPTTDPYLDALAKVGLVDKKPVMMKNVMQALSGGPKEYPGTRYEVSAAGRKYAAHPKHSALMLGAETFCYGLPEVVDIVRYSEPDNMMGQTMTDVTYTYDLKDPAPWISASELQHIFPELGHVPTRDHPQEGKMALVLMSGGWRATGLGF
jgi:hypothetical protein